MGGYGEVWSSGAIGGEDRSFGDDDARSKTRCGGTPSFELGNRSCRDNAETRWKNAQGVGNLQRLQGQIQKLCRPWLIAPDDPDVDVSSSLAPIDLAR
jgi:hypothetical protein